MMITLSHYLVLSAILFSISVAGIFLNRKNLIVLLMAIELMLLAVNMNFIAFSHHLGDSAGQVFVFFILTVAAAESAIGLALTVAALKVPHFWPCEAYTPLHGRHHARGDRRGARRGRGRGATVAAGLRGVAQTRRPEVIARAGRTHFASARSWWPVLSTSAYS